MNDEANVPTWYSTILLFCVALSSFAVHYLNQSLENGYSRGNFWFGFGLVYCFLSIDEAARLHEFINYITATKWTYVYAPFAAIFFAITARYLVVTRREDKTLRNWIIGGLFIYGIGGLGLEFISYMIPLPSLLQFAAIILEEGLEMIGTIMVLTGCLLETRLLFLQQFKPLAEKT